MVAAYFTPLPVTAQDLLSELTTPTWLVGFYEVSKMLTQGLFPTSKYFVNGSSQEQKSKHYLHTKKPVPSCGDRINSGRADCCCVTKTIDKGLLGTGYSHEAILENKSEYCERKDYLNIPYEHQYEASVGIYRTPFIWNTAKDKLTNPRLEYFKEAVGHDP